MSLLDLLSRHVEADPEGTALIFEGSTGGAWTYSQLAAAGKAVAAALSQAGVRRDDRVAVLLGNRPETVTSWLGLLELGAVLVPINLAYRDREIRHILDDASPRLVLTDREHEAALDAAGADLPILVVEELARPEEPSHRQASDEQQASEDRQANEDQPASEPGRADDAAMILYTSGTTGRSKGAVLSHANVAATVSALREAWAWSADDVLLLALPLFHTHGLVVGLLTALASGATVRLWPRFEAAPVLDALADPAGEPRPSLFFGVPTMYVRLVDELRRRGAPDLSGMRLFCSGSAPLDPETFAAFEQLTGHAILERYGMTETGMLLSNPYRGRRLPGTVGRELPGVSARVVGENDEPLADGEEGELLVRGANVFAGYHNAPDATRVSFLTDDSGRDWFRTGDLARRDPSTGYYALLGRRHELVISGGFNVYPREVEEVLATLPGVREAAVVGRPHPEWGEQVVAFLVTDGPLDRERITAACKETLANFKVPRRLEQLASLPRNALGKVQKHRLPD